jgi:hypothetical protein
MRLLYAEPLSRRMRVRFGEKWIADTKASTTPTGGGIAEIGKILGVIQEVSVIVASIAAAIWFHRRLDVKPK